MTVTAYAVERPDKSWAVLFVNKDPKNPRTVRVAFHDRQSNRDLAFEGGVSMATFGADRYVWHPKGADGYADPDGPIARTTEAGGAQAQYVLPRASVTVLRGTIR